MPRKTYQPVHCTNCVLMTTNAFFVLKSKILLQPRQDSNVNKNISIHFAEIYLWFLEVEVSKAEKFSFPQNKIFLIIFGCFPEFSLSNI